MSGRMAACLSVQNTEKCFGQELQGLLLCVMLPPVTIQNFWSLTRHQEFKHQQALRLIALKAAAMLSSASRQQYPQHIICCQKLSSAFHTPQHRPHKNEFQILVGQQDKIRLRFFWAMQVSQYLENYLWPNLDPATATPAHILSIAAMVAEKARENVPAWGFVSSRPPEIFSAFFSRWGFSRCFCDCCWLT